MCGIGYPARLCSSEGRVNDLEEEALKGEHINEDGYWTEEDDETPLLPSLLLTEDCTMHSVKPRGVTKIEKSPAFLQEER